MRYKFGDRVIRSENAAKSYKQKSKHVVDYFSRRPRVERLLDFGCGKLRYSEELLAISEHVTFVDSFVQLNRTQVVRGVLSSVREYVSDNYERAVCVAFEDSNSTYFLNDYDLVSCTNVLSAIACQEIMAKALGLIKSSLGESGEAIFINQYRCSSFSKFEIGKPHMHGYVYDSRNGSSYYGLMKNSTVSELLVGHGFQVTQKWTKDDVGFVLACRQ